MKNRISFVFILITLLCAIPCVAQQNSDSSLSTKSSGIAQDMSLDSLLEQVKSGRVKDNDENSARLARFKQMRSERENLLNDIIAQQKQQEDISTEKERLFEDNETRLSDLQKRLDERLGALRELFGVLQQVSGDMQGQLSASVTQIEFPQRSAFLEEFSRKMGQTNELPSVREIERLWFEMQREMTESSKIKQSEQSVINAKGVEVKKDVVRIGSFNIVADGRYLQFIPETGRVVEYARQPSGRFLVGAEQIGEGKTGLVEMTIDPARGQLLSLIVQAPKMLERIIQGGFIGYAIIALGFATLLMALYRLAVLVKTDLKVKKQKNELSCADTTNPLGRILNEHSANSAHDLATIELKMGEAVLRELPEINRGLSFLKIIAAVAPLLGLLGTVTGMIVTFQAITLFGAGDPKLMAGGISQALMTTVLGLCVAIPTLLLHNVLQSKAQGISETLEQEATALVANFSQAEPEKLAA